MSYGAALAWGVGIGALVGVTIFDDVAIGVIFGIAIAYAVRAATGK